MLGVRVLNNLSDNLSDLARGILLGVNHLDVNGNVLELDNLNLVVLGLQGKAKVVLIVGRTSTITKREG